METFRLLHAKPGGLTELPDGRGNPSRTAVVELPQHALELLHLLLQERPHLIRLCKKLGAALPAQLSAADVPEQVPETQERAAAVPRGRRSGPGGGRPRLPPPSGSGAGCASRRPEAAPRPAPPRCARRRARPPGLAGPQGSSRKAQGCQNAFPGETGMRPHDLLDRLPGGELLQDRLNGDAGPCDDGLPHHDCWIGLDELSIHPCAAPPPARPAAGSCARRPRGRSGSGG